MRNASTIRGLAADLLRIASAFVLFCCSAVFSQDASDHVVFLNQDNSDFDSIGDPLPNRAVMRFGTMRFQNPSSVNTMVLSPDDKHLVALTGNALIGWDTATGKQLWRSNWRFSNNIGPAYGQRYICFDNTSSKLYQCGKELELRVIDAATGVSTPLKLRREIDQVDLFSARNNGLASVDVSSDGEHILVGSESGVGLYDSSGKMSWYVPNTPKAAIQFGAGNRDRLDFGGDFSSAQFSPAGKIAAAVMSDARKKIKLINLTTGRVDSEIKTMDKPVRIAFSPDGKSIFATERDCGIRCYSTDTQKMTWELALTPDATGAESYASAIACSSDGKIIAAGAPIGPKNWVYLIDAETGKDISILKKCGWKPWALQFSSDNQTLFVSGWGGAVQRWDVASAKRLGLPVGFRGSSTITHSIRGNRIAFRDGDGQTRIVDGTTGQQTHAKSIKGSGVLLFSPDGKRLFAGGTNGDKVQVNVWDLQQDSVDQVWSFDKGKDSHSEVEELATDAKGRFLAAAVFRQSAAYLWDTETGKRLAKLKHRSVYGLAISPDGKTLITVGWDKKIRVWSIPSGELINTILVTNVNVDPKIAADDPRMYGVRYSPDGHRIACAHLNGTISIWKSDDPTEIEPIYHFAGERLVFGAFDFSPDGLWIASGRSSGTVEVHDSFTGEKMLTVGEHDNYVYSTRFGGDHTRLVTGGRGVSYLWALDDIGDLADTQPESLWQQLRRTQKNDEQFDPDVYPAIIAISKSKPACELVTHRLLGIEAVGDPQSTRSNKANSPVRAAMMRKAESDDRFEMRGTVHRALIALRLSGFDESMSSIERMSKNHPNKVVRELAARLLRAAQGS